MKSSGMSQAKGNSADWTFNGASTRELSHCFHDYPARMIPQVAAKLLDLYGQGATRLFDPYCGTGTSLVEALIRGIDSVGTDLNPLARLIARAKTTLIDGPRLERSIRLFDDEVFQWKFGKEAGDIDTPAFANIDYWFSPEVVVKLALLKQFIYSLPEQDVREFFLIAFSETVRESSFTRNGEFKLFRMSEDRLSHFYPDVYAIMARKLDRNKTGMLALVDAVSKAPRKAGAKICAFNTVENIPNDLTGTSFDLVVTSPPYGDSRTTVAYGQYSRLSSQWMDLIEAGTVDSDLMGGKPSNSIPTFGCQNLDESIERIAATDSRRVRDVASFYLDLKSSISNISPLIARGGYACYVVGNRRVKGVTLPTDEAIVAFFESNSFRHVDTHVRNIPNKRMPSRNSPSNITGEQDTTMINEHVVVMKKL